MTDMTKEEVIELIEKLDDKERVDVEYFDECTRAAGALVRLGVVKDEDGNYEPDLAVLGEYPDSVKEFVGGMVWSSDEGKKTKH